MANHIFQRTKFEGALSAAEFSLPVHFGVEVDDRGRLDVVVDDIPLENPAYLRLHETFSGDRAEWLHLTGTSGTGEFFQSNHFLIRSLGTKFSQDYSFITIKGQCEVATIRLAHNNSDQKGVYFGLRGFESLSPTVKVSIIERGAFALSVPMRLGSEDHDRITGKAQILAPMSASAVGPEWNEQAEDLGLDLLLALSAASGVNLSPRAIWIADPPRHLVLKIKRCPDAIPSGIKAISDFSLQAYMDAIAQSVKINPSILDELRFALEWMNVPASHSEVRLFASATALENLIAKGLNKEERTLLPADIFVPLKSEVQKTIANAVEDDAARNRLVIQNEVGFRNKIERLMKKWGATSDYLPQHAIRDAIDARNKVTHRGVYEDESGRGVWPHAMVLRELVFRLVFARLNFVGRYISFIGKFHERTFPACAPLTENGLLPPEGVENMP